MLRHAPLLTAIALAFLLTSVVPTAHAEWGDTLAGDALYAPRPIASTRAIGATPDRYMPSAFLAGSIAVRLIFPESDGGTQASTENWTTEATTEIENSVHDSLDWWAARVPNAKVTFTVTSQIVPTTYEPITNGLSTENRWVGDTLTQLGFAGSNHYEQAYSANEALRREFDTDWATTIFVVNSAADVDGRFNDGYFAYAYVNGPFLVLTSDVGAYGIDKMAPVMTHELGHIFGALDQYQEAGTPCTMKSGYLAVASTNSQANNCGSRFICIMWEPVPAYEKGQVDQSALGQIGYRDSDNDTIPDPIDTMPTLTVTIMPQTGARPRVLARAIDQPFVAPSQRAVSINTITRIEYRTDGGEWAILPPADGQYDTVEELVDTPLALYDGMHTVELRATNRVGATSPVITQKVTVTGVGAAPRYSFDIPPFISAPALNVALAAPVGFEARIGTDPTFSNSNWQPASAPMSVGANKEGERILYTQMRDEQGLETPIYSQRVLIDRTPPTGAAHLQANTQRTLVIDAQDEGSGVAAMLIDSSIPASEQWQPYSRESTLSSGAWPTQVFLRDRAGNISALLTIQSGLASTMVYLPLATH